MRKYAFIFAILLAGSLFPCTIGVASGRATPDGRPIIWKNRDSSGYLNYVAYFKGRFYDYLGVINKGGKTEIYAGVNEAGFAILNSLLYDVKSSGWENGDFMKLALETCGSIKDFEKLLERTKGRRKVSANFAVIDAYGGAALFEVGESFHVKYDAASAPGGYILRTNFSMVGKGKAGIERFERQKALVAGHKISVPFLLRNVLRDITDIDGQPYSPSVNKRFFRVKNSICRDVTTSAVVIQGVKGEPPSLSTVWVITSNPLTGPAIPLWVYSGRVPAEVNSGTQSLLNDRMREIYGLLFNLEERTLDLAWLPELLPEIRSMEDGILSRVEAVLSSWRKRLPPREAVAAFQESIAEEVLDFETLLTSKLRIRRAFSEINPEPLLKGRVKQLGWFAWDGSRYVYITDRASHRLLRLDLARRRLKKLAGGKAGFRDGALKKALFKNPGWIGWFEPGKLLLVDQDAAVLRLVNLDKKEIRSFKPGLRYRINAAGRRDSRVLLFAGPSVWRFDPKKGRLSRVAGKEEGFRDGSDLSARIGLAFRAVAGEWETFYFIDKINRAVRMLTGSSVVLTLAGRPAQGSMDGRVEQALFKNLNDLTLDPDGKIWVLDGSRLRVILPSGHVITAVDLKEKGISEPLHILWIDSNRLLAGSRKELYLIRVSGF